MHNFMVVEYTYFKTDENGDTKIMYRVFDRSDADTLDDCQQFCREVASNGGAVNIRNRDFDTMIFN